MRDDGDGPVHCPTRDEAVGSMDWLRDAKVQGKKPYEDPEYYGTEYEIRNMTLADFSREIGQGNFTIERAGGTFRMQGYVDMSGGNGTIDLEDMRGADVRIAVTFPGPVLSSENGRVDGRKVVFTPKLGDRLTIDVVAAASAKTSNSSAATVSPSESAPPPRSAGESPKATRSATAESPDAEARQTPASARPAGAKFPGAQSHPDAEFAGALTPAGASPATPSLSPVAREAMPEPASSMREWAPGAAAVLAALVAAAAVTTYARRARRGEAT